MARNDKGQPEKTSFPFVTSMFPTQVPPVAGIDNSKFKVFEDYKAGFGADGKRKPDAKTTLDSDLETLSRQEKEGKAIEPKLKENLTKLKRWWDTEGQPHYEVDKGPLMEARLKGAKTALLYTAFAPLALAIGFMILIAYFFFTGGYKQVHLDESHPPDGGVLITWRPSLPGLERSLFDALIPLPAEGSKAPGAGPPANAPGLVAARDNS